MSRRAIVFFVVCGIAAPLDARAETSTRPTKQHVEAFLSKALVPFRACLAKSLPSPPRPTVMVTVEFAREGGFPMPMEVQAAPGSAIERCMGEALVELLAPPVPGPPLRVQCQFPLVRGNRVICRLVSRQEARRPPPVPPPRQPSGVAAQPQRVASPETQGAQHRNTDSGPAVDRGTGQSGAPAPPSAPPSGTEPPPSATEPPLSRQEVATAMSQVSAPILECVAGDSPPSVVRVRVAIAGDGGISLLETLPAPPAEVSRCISDVIAGARVRATGRETIRVLYPIRTTE